MRWAVVADSETCTSECMPDQLATLGCKREIGKHGFILGKTGLHFRENKVFLETAKKGQI